MSDNQGDRHFVMVNSGPSEAQKLLDSFWPRELEAIQNLDNNAFRNPELPLARIKKIMKLDEDVKMIAGEAPVLFAKAVEIFIAELSLRAWVNTEDNKRRTLQRNDIAMGISKYDQFDFLIDIVPREEAKPPKRSEPSNAVMTQEQLNYFLQMAHQQQQQQLQGGAGQPIQIVQASGQGQPFAITPQVIQIPVPNTGATQSREGSVLTNQQVIQLNHSHSADSQRTAVDKTSTTATTSNTNLGSTQLILSNVYNNGDMLQQLPITLSSQQYQTVMHNQNSGQGQQIIISNPQSLQMPAQFITNTGQVVQAIIPTATAAGGTLSSNKQSEQGAS